jgi:poly(A)-specific ribonuclease
MVESTRSFIITQFGLSCFERVEGGARGGREEYAARTFNFWVFPQVWGWWRLFR